jgi:hypothetical protein
MLLALASCAGGSPAQAARGDLEPAGCYSYVSPAPPGCVADSVETLKNSRGVVVSADGTRVYVASRSDPYIQSNDTVAVYARDPSTQALTSKGCIGQGSCAGHVAIGQVGGIAVAANGTVYLSTSKGIWVLAPDGSAPGLHATSCIGDPAAGCTASAAADGPVAVSPDGHSLYAASGSARTVRSYSIDPGTGALTLLGCVGGGATVPPGCVGVPDAGALGNPQSVVVAPGTSRDVYVASESSIDHLQRDDTGNLSYRGCTGSGSGCGGTHVNGTGELVVSPDGTNVYTTSETFVSGTTVDELSSFTRAQSTGDLSLDSCVADQSGDPPCSLDPHSFSHWRGLTISPDGADVVVGALDSASNQLAMLTYGRSSNGGTLALQQCLESTATTDCGAAAALASVSASTASADGFSVYAVSQTSTKRLLSFTRLEPPSCAGGSYTATTGVTHNLDLHCAAPAGHAIDVTSQTITTAPSHGITGFAFQPWLVAYRATAPYTGPDALEATVSNNVGVSTPAHASILVGPQSGAPVCEAVSAGVSHDTPTQVHLNCAGAPGQTLTFQASSGTSAQGGTVSAATADGTVTYTPPSGFEGTDTFTYTAANVSDNASSAPATVTLTVESAPRAPASGILTACGDPGHPLLLVSTGSCGAQQTLTWNQRTPGATGPRGDQGLPGRTGDPGLQGPSGIRLLQGVHYVSQLWVANSSELIGQAYCSPGEVAIGGGLRQNDYNGMAGVYTTVSQPIVAGPDAVPVGWMAGGVNTIAFAAYHKPLSITVFATCIRAGR